MERGPKIFIVMVAVTAIIVASIGIVQLQSALYNPSESDALGEWKLSKYDGYSYDDELLSITMKDGSSSDYDINITSSKDGIITGTYLGNTFKGTVTGRMFEASFSSSGEVFNIFGYLDSGSEMHLGIASLKDGKVSSSMAVYNRDGSRTVYEDDCKSIVGDWKVDSSVKNDTSESVVSLTVEKQEFSIFRGKMTYESKTDMMTGFITPSKIGPTNLGMMIDTDGNVWNTLSMRGQVRLMNDYSEYLMTEDGGYVQSFMDTNIQGCMKHNDQGASITVEEQDSYTIMGKVTDGKEYQLYGSFILSSSSKVLSVSLVSGTEEYEGFMTVSDSITISAIDSAGNVLYLTLDKEGSQ